MDVAAAIVEALKDDGTSMGKVYELGGPDVYTVRQLVIFSVMQPKFLKEFMAWLIEHYQIFVLCRLSLCMKLSVNGLAT